MLNEPTVSGEFIDDDLDMSLVDRYTADVRRLGLAGTNDQCTDRLRFRGLGEAQLDLHGGIPSRTEHDGPEEVWSMIIYETGVQTQRLSAVPPIQVVQRAPGPVQ